MSTRPVAVPQLMIDAPAAPGTVSAAATTCRRVTSSGWSTVKPAVIPVSDRTRCSKRS